MKMVLQRQIITEHRTGSSLHRPIPPPLTLRTSPPPKPQTAVKFTTPPPNALNSKLLSYQVPQEKLYPSVPKYMLHTLFITTTTTQSKLASHEVYIIPFLFHPTKLEKNFEISRLVLCLSVRMYFHCHKTANLHVAVQNKQPSQF